MDQDAFFETCREISDRHCAYEKSILSGQCDCSQATRLNIAEREVVYCRLEEGYLHCEALLKLLRRHAMFTLKAKGNAGTLAHAKMMRIQVGGLRGLHISIHGEQKTLPPPDNIYLLINEAIERFQSLDNLPFQEIIKQIAAYQGRRKRSRG